MTTPKPGATTSALERTIGASMTLQAASAAAVVQLARTLATQIDATNGEPNTRLVAAYLSTLKDLRRISSNDPTAPKTASRLALIQAQAKKTGAAK